MVSVWIGAILLAIIIELFATSFLVAPFALGGMAALGSLLLISNSLLLQLIVFILFTTIGFLLFYPLNRKLQRSNSTKTNTQALLGKEALSISSITENGGQIKLNGEIWTAKSWLENEIIENENKVEVVKIEGATAIVRPL